jgi:transcriptional regulator with XRE-family HTH domain
MTEQPILVQARKHGMTLDKVADRMGIHVRTLLNWTTRSRRPSPPQVTALASALECNVGDLYDPDAPDHDAPTNPQRRPWGATNQPVVDARDRFLAARAKGRASADDPVAPDPA